jgi:quercetin dioxygenase-like cupin family protein
MMTLIAFPNDPTGLASYLPARAIGHGTVPWVPLGPGKAFKPLRFLRDDRGFAELIRLDPGQEIPRHRHTGEVHAMNLEGSRQLDTGEIVGPGDYVYEPAGNVDAWKVVGDVPLVVLVVVTGAVEYLDARGNVTKRYTAQTLSDLYDEYCRARGIGIRDLVE